MGDPVTSQPVVFSSTKSSTAPAAAAVPASATLSKHSVPSKEAVSVSKGNLCPSPSQSLANISTGTTNGVKKINWADSDDDEDFLASFIPNKTTRIQELQDTVAAMDARITDLTTVIRERDSRIAKVESTAKEQQRRLADLQESMKGFAGQIEELKKESHKQPLQVQELVAKVDAKDQRIAPLEIKVDEHRTTITELDLGDKSTQVSSQDAPVSAEGAGQTKMERLKAQSTDEDVKTTKQPAQHIGQATTVKSAGDAFASEMPSPESKPAPTKESVPSVNLAGFPIFATRSTVKNIPPPPPAPKLKMGVDLSKFAHKPAIKQLGSKHKAGTESEERIAKSGPVPKIDPSQDIRTKPHHERVLFANGPKAQVLIGDIVLATVPKYLLMQCSMKAHKHFSDHPDATSFTLPAGSMDVDAAKAHLRWMKEMTFQSRVYSITLHADETFDNKNLQICRAARVLGLSSMYVGHFTKIFCDRIRSDLASFEFMSKVAALAYPENDPIYDCLANNLATFRMRNTVKKPAELEAFLKKHADLKTRVEKIEERMRKELNGQKGTKVVHVGRKTVV